MSDDATFRLCDIDEVPLFVLIKITSDMLLFKDNVYLLTAKTAMEMFVTKKSSSLLIAIVYVIFDYATIM